jgi:squalene-hopene/tetraprenyl-beta-curcumene cyclase
MTTIPCRWAPCLLALFLAGFFPAGAKTAPPAKWDSAAAAKYLDGRTATWFGWDGAARGQGADRSSCVSCHTLLPFALARPVLRKLSGQAQPTDFEARLLAQTSKRVANWDRLDTPALRLMYDSSKRKKTESWGTEAVLSALILARDDRAQGRAAPSSVTRTALAHLWKTQVSEGEHKGSWDWLNFGLEPWESDGGRYFGAALAAVAVGTAPGYYTQGTDAEVDGRVEWLRAYLRDKLSGQNLFNQACALWAAARLPGVLSHTQHKEIVRRLLEKQLPDGGWRLASLGTFQRGDGAPQDAGADGYATGFVLHVLQTAGVPRSDPAVARGLAWLRANQDSAGGWRGSSVNRRRDPATHVGKFMSDAATGFAVLALGDH